MSVALNQKLSSDNAEVTEKVSKLSQALEADFALLSCGKLGEWESQSENSLAGEVPLILIEQVADKKVSMSNEIEVGKQWLLVPMKSAHLNSVNHVAAALIDTDSPEIFCKLADSVIHRIEQQNQINQLTEENNIFLQQVSEDFEELAFLRGMAERLALGKDSEDLQVLIRHTLPLLGKAVGVQGFYFLTEHNSQLKIDEEWIDGKPSEETFSNESVLRIAKMFSNEAQSGPVVKNGLQTAEFAKDIPGIHSVVLVELISDYGNHGWFLAVNRLGTTVEYSYQSICCLSQNELGTNEASLINTAAAMVSSHAHNLVLLDEREKLLVNMVRTLVSAVDSRDPYTCGHSERVALYGRKLAEATGFREEACERLYLTGLLHDIGKIGVSDAVLNKKGALTDEEFAEIKKHPDFGWSILRELEQLQYVLPGVLHHHERYDGKGYPDGLAGEDTPVDGRLLAVVDAFDAMTSDRPYRQGMPVEKAIGILADGAGTQWDSEIVEAFIQILPEILEIKDTYQRPPLPQRDKAALNNVKGSLSY